VSSGCWKRTLDSAEQLRYRRARSRGGMGPRDPKDVARDMARDLSGLAGELASLKADARHWLEGPEYATLKHRLENAHAAVEAALVEARRRVRMNEERER
jgi:hypothetical protein